ncbi:NADH:flavin oxidoreductase/NADH oxidase [Salinicola sp. MIT1003]|uniref:NADH:flavin oxidoreductase/NADH oxidase n=1 Tax=Salinicola sp. MIT1003 TaxID=1882734 RepID=UPI0009F61486|nr:NADH:flavin oxidoreductase/NADH oxidase [Salinicola sp. MIT1003]
MGNFLFKPYKMRELLIDNRIVVSPMAQYSADNEGRAGDWHFMHLVNLAVSGAGLLILEATAVEPRGRVSPNCLGLWSDTHIPRLQRIIEFARCHGTTKLGIQLAHAGRKASVCPPWLGGKGLLPDEGGWELIGASDLPYPGRPTPLPLDDAGLLEIKQRYIEAAMRAEKLGFDLIELHCAHGYLLNSFLSPLSNSRNDKYGGDIEGRMRYPLEVFRAVRAVWPEHKPLGVRISATDWVQGGWDTKDSVIFARELKELGCDYIATSSGGISPDQKITVYSGYQVPFAEQVRHEAGVPTMAMGHIMHGPQANEILSLGQADLIAIGRGMTYNPRWAWHAAEALEAEVSFPPQYARSSPSLRKLPR